MARSSWPGRSATTSVPVGDLLAGLPRVESVTELKCVEGWSEVVHWGGVRFADVAAARGWPLDRFAVRVARDAGRGCTTSGWTRPAPPSRRRCCATRLAGEPLPPAHGGPLRLVIPVKYGIKNLKWVGRIEFTDARPADYWAERGYDWYAGL